MKEVQKVQVSPRLWYVMFFGAALFISGFVMGAVFVWPGAPSADGQAAQPQPTAPTPETPQPTGHECVMEPWNPLRAIANRVERGITRERLERAVAELDDGRLSPKTVRSERVTLVNGTSSAMEYWSWNLRMKKADKETWVITLTLDLLDDKVVGIHYSADYDVAVVAIHK